MARGKGHNGGGRPRSGLTVELVIKALSGTGGIKAAAAQSLGVGRTTLYTFINANPDLKETIDEINQTTLDVAEGEILKAIKKGDLRTCRWFLDRMGKNRGYGNITIGLKNDDAEPLRVATEEVVDYSRLTIEERRQMLDLKRKAMAQPDAVNAAPSK